MSDIKTINDNPNGLHQRYVIRKVVGIRREGFFDQERFITEAVDPKAEYFVMRLDEGGKDIKHIAACRIGIHAYAEAIKDHIPQLAKDLKERYPLIEKVFIPIPFSRELHYMCGNCGHHNIVFGHPNDEVTSKCENCKHQTIQTFSNNVD